MIFRYLLVVLVLLIFQLKSTAQEMDQGFGYLENGEFAAAKDFFSEILETYPENKTARLCYARAIGLHDDPSKANNLFSELLKEYPGDLEIQLNYAESLLWNKNYEEAEVYYRELVKENPDNFGALLGYANTLSNLKEYEQALSLINKSLEVSPQNPNAMLSRKYIRLGYANQFLTNRDFETAIRYLDDNLSENEQDQESLLNKANVYLIQKNGEGAREVYEKLALTKNDSILAFNGISLSYHIDGDEKEALKYAEKAYDLAKTSSDDVRLLDAEERYVQALIWNRKFSQAEDLIADLKQKYPEESRILALEASMGMYTGEFKNSIENYKAILAQDSASFDGNLGIANAYFANSEIIKAKNAAEKTLEYYTNQQDAQQFLTKLNNTYRPLLEENISYSFDNGDNEAVASTTSLVLPLSTKLEVSGAYTFRETMNSNSDLEATSNQFNLAGSYRWSPGLLLRANAGFVKANSSQTEYTNAVGEIAARLKPFVRDDLEIGYRRDIQDFNAELLNRQIAGNHFFLNNNYSTRYGLGWYLQYLHTEQSDDNTRDLLFTSFYYSFLKKPVLKGGLNYQFIQFKNQVPTIYFSPEQFHATEIFLNFLSNDPDSRISYDLTAATGFQFIEDDEKQGTYRLQGKLGYNISDRFIAGIYGNHSNIASATAAGFTYTEFGISLKWNFKSTPLFAF